MRDPREGLTPDGLITTGADLARVPPAFEAVVAAAADALAPYVGELLLYGSVATGQARPGRSDLDLVAADADPEEVARVAAALGERFAGVVRGVGVGVAGPDAHRGEGDAAHGDRVFLRHYCVPLVGPDALRGTRRYRGDAAAARGFNGDLGTRLAGWRREAPDAELATRVGRKTLFAVAGLVSVTDATWTTDRGTAAARWAEVRPELTPELRALLAWAEGAPAPGEEVAAALAPGGVVEAVRDDFAAEVGLWREGR